MRKIPTLFVRDPDNRRYVTDQVTPGCEWVLAGEGRATRKFDGTCILVLQHDADARVVFARRVVKEDKVAPPGFDPVETDPDTGKTVGWEPYEQSSFAKFIDEALEDRPVNGSGTYELCGPKINGNPEGFERHTLVPHGGWTIDDDLSSLDAIRRWLQAHPAYEGIVWWHDDGRQAKIKNRDFRV